MNSRFTWGIKTTLLMIPILLLLAALPCRASEKDQAVDLSLHYLLGPGDLLHITVWKNEDLSRVIPVLPDGKITFPLIGEVAAGGRMVSELKTEIAQKLTSFVKDPVLTIVVNQVNSLNVYVIGKVNNPGRFVLTSTVNALQALAMAGGLNAFAKRDQIRIFREEQNETIIFSFNYDEVAKGNNLAQNIHLQRGDVIVVP